MLLPERLNPGDRIGILSPSGPAPTEEIEAGLEVLRNRGYLPVEGEHVRERHPSLDYLAGTDLQRAADIHSLFTDPSLKAVFAVRGGYGAMRLFPSIDSSIYLVEPKVFLGYSDVTSLHLVFNGAGSWVTFYGPNLGTLTRRNPIIADCLWRLLEDPAPFGLMPADPYRMHTVKLGSAEGELAGGTLCLLAHACGSKYQPDFRGKIVVLEDVSEAVYRADRYLVQLLNAGALQHAAGFVVGEITGWEKEEADPPRSRPETIWEELLAPLGKPVITGFPFGHVPEPLTIPLGVTARLDADAKTLTLLEGAVM